MNVQKETQFLKRITIQSNADRKIIFCSDYKKLRNEITKKKRDSKNS